MRALVQRVERASVTVDGRVVGAIGPGLCVFVGVTHGDTPGSARKLAGKVWHLRVFDDVSGSGPRGMHRSLADLAASGGVEAGGDGSVLVVSQFTLYGDTSRGRRPSWSAAARPEHAEPLVTAFADALRAFGATVATGVFGAHMRVELVNDGPVTLSLEV